MATTSVIGALRVVLGADTAAFDKGLKSAESSLSKFSNRMLTIAAGIEVSRIFSSITSGIASGMKDVIEEADNIGKASQRIGIAVEELSKLKYAADINDLSFQQLEKSVGKLNQSIGQAASDATSKAGKQFRALGIEVRNANDGSLKPTTTILSELATKFSTMSDGATKGSVAMNLMGKTGRDMIPMLNSGAKGIEALTKEAEALGAVITTRVANSADRMSDDFKRLTTVNKGLSNSIIQELAPYMGVLTDRFVEFMSEGKKASEFGVTLIEWSLSLSEKILRLGAAIARTTEEIAAFGRGLRALATLDMAGVQQAITDMGAAGTKFYATLDANNAAFDKLRTDAAKLRDELGKGRDGARDYGNELAKGKNALDEFVKSQQKAIAKSEADVAALGRGVGARENLRIQFEAEAIRIQNNIPLTQAYIDKINALAFAAENAAIKMQAGKAIEESIPAWEKYQIKIAELKEGFDQLGTSAEVRMRTLRGEAEKVGATWDQVSGTIAGNFSKLFQEMGKSGGKWAELAKGLAIFEATINTYTAFTKALNAPPGPPISYAIAAATLAAGMAKVMAIKSQALPKMATGGMIRPNSFAGQDSALLQARVRPDEQIDIWRPGEGPDPRRGAGGMGREIIIRVDEISRATVEKLIPALNSAIGDGYKLKMAG